MKIGILPQKGFHPIVLVMEFQVWRYQISKTYFLNLILYKGNDSNLSKNENFIFSTSDFEISFVDSPSFHLKRYQIISMQINPNISSMESKKVDRVNIYFKDPNFNSKFLSSSFKHSNKEIDFARRERGSRIFSKYIVI